MAAFYSDVLAQDSSLRKNPAHAGYFAG